MYYFNGDSDGDDGDDGDDDVDDDNDDGNASGDVNKEKNAHCWQVSDTGSNINCFRVNLGVIALSWWLSTSPSIC